MDETLNTVLGEMLAALDTPTTRQYAADCVSLPPARRLDMARVYRDCARRWAILARARASAGAPGPVLGAAPRPRDVDHYVLDADGRVHGPTRKPVPDATHWCRDSGGWFRIPEGRPP